MAKKIKSNDIVTINNNNSTKENTMTTTTKKTAPVIEAITKIKPKVTPETLVLPEGVEMKILGSCVKFFKGDLKAYLKGKSLEITKITTTLSDRITEFTTEQKEKCHLGKSLGLIPSITDNIDLEKILTKYFKDTKITTTKTETAKEETPAIA